LPFKTTFIDNTTAARLLRETAASNLHLESYNSTHLRFGTRRKGSHNKLPSSNLSLRRVAKISRHADNWNSNSHSIIQWNNLSS